MIAKHQEPRPKFGQTKPQHYNYKRLGNYCRDKEHEGEKCLMSWFAGCNAPDYDLALEEIKATQAMNTRAKSDKTYHLEISFHPEDEAKLTSEAYQRIERAFAEELGLSEHQRVCGVHKNTARIHIHVAYNLIHPEKFTMATTLWYDYQKLSKVCRAMEEEYGLVVDNGYEQRNTQQPKISQRAAAMEAHSGEQSFQSYALHLKDTVMRRMASATTWEDAQGILADYGMALRPKANGLVLVPLNGEGSLKASAFDKSMSRMRMEKRFGAFVAPEKAQSEPVGRAAPGLDTEMGQAEVAPPQPGEPPPDEPPAGEQQTRPEGLLGRKEQILELVRTAQDWQELHRVLAEHGLSVKPMGNGLVFSDASGETVKASALDRSLSKAKLEAGFGAFAAPENGQGRGGVTPEDLSEHAARNESKYQKKPKQPRSPERDQLYKDYQAALAEKIARIDAEKARSREAHEGLKERWQRMKADLSAKTFSRRTRAVRLRMMRELHMKEVAREKDGHKTAMAAIKADYAWYNWNTYLQDQVKKGNTTALAVLRSQEERKAAQAGKKPEQPAERPTQEKDAKREEKPETKTEERKAPGARLARLAEIEAMRVKLGGAAASHFAGYSYRIDNRGVVIIRLASGGTIRDTGDKLHFSREADTRQAARLYAQAKFGKAVKEKENSIERRERIGNRIARLVKPHLGILRDAARNGVRSLSQLNLVFGRQKQTQAKVLLQDHAHDDLGR